MGGFLAGFGVNHLHLGLDRRVYPRPVDPKTSDLPDEQGLYINVRGEWKAIDFEVINMRTANVLGHAMSYGIAKAKLKGTSPG